MSKQECDWMSKCMCEWLRGGLGGNTVFNIMSQFWNLFDDM